MKIFEDVMNEYKTTIEAKTFHDIVREARDLIGLRQYRAAEFLGIRINRLKNLETGYFRQPPSRLEIQSFANLYDLPYETLKRKVDEHIENHKKNRKVRTVYDGSPAAPHLRKDG